MYYTIFGYLNVLITYYWNSMANLYHTALCHQLYLFSDIAILLSSYPPELAYFEIRITFFACVPKICWLHSVLPTLTVLKFYNWNLREMNMNLTSPFTICVKRELWELQFSLFFVIFRVKLAYFCVISREIAEITGIRHE